MTPEGLCACGKPGAWEYDPFIREIYDEIAMGYWCDDCLYQRAMET